MQSLKRSLTLVKRHKTAIGHFNVSDLVTLKAVFEAGQELSKSTGQLIPLLIGLSEGEREFMGAAEMNNFVKFLRKTYDYPIFTNADHTHSLEKVKKAVDAGFDAILFDGGKLPLEENIKQTKEVVQYVKSKNKKILVEGEMGYIGSGSEVFKEIPAGAALKPEEITKPEEAQRFVAETGVDLFAPAVGNIHGMSASGTDPHLYIDAIKKMKRAAKVPLVLHGGSGTPEEDFEKAIAAGIRVLHISTELRKAWRDNVKTTIASQPDEVAPYKLMTPAVDAIKKIVIARLKLFSRV